jgi:hypothetical protein
LAIGTLEPDYCQEQKRYLAYNDPALCSYTIAEEELRKMPKLFKASSISVQVSSGNNEGQSDWSIMKVDLTARDLSAPSRVSVASGAGGGPSLHASTTGARPAAPTSSEGGKFDRQVDELSGRKLEEWLRGQLKSDIQVWLRKRFQSTSGSKEDLLKRVISYKEEDPYEGL